MSRVFVRIHWCWGGVAVPMAAGTGHGPCRCGKSSRVFRCCLISIPLLSFQMEVI